MHVLVTGATGYIGGRLVPRLLARGHLVRCVARHPEGLAGRVWPGIEIVQGDLIDPSVLRRYWRESTWPTTWFTMAEGETFAIVIDLWPKRSAERPRRPVSAKLSTSEDSVAPKTHSRHLISRHEVGRTLAVAGVPVVEFRAAVIVGSGSASFEMIRHLVERMPMMVAPRWINTRCQPISVRDVLDYLTTVLDHDGASGVYEIGGRDVLSYREMMVHYARIRGLRRIIVAHWVPRPEWSSRFVGLVTPIPFRIAQPLIQSLRTEVVVSDDRALREFEVRPMGYDEAVQRAMARLAADDVETTWASSLASLNRDQLEGHQLATHEGMLLERHHGRIEASPERVFDIICELGGDRGWPAGNALWQLRGLLDRVFGGVGMRRGRRHPRELRAGDHLDFWRVEAVESPHLLRLRAEMKLPGRAWLQFEVLPDARGARVEQTALYEPRGILGYLYWYAVRPFHRFVFPGLLSAVRERAEAT